MYALSGGLALSYAIQLVEYSVGTAYQTNDSFIPIPSSYRCLVYQLLQVLEEILVPSVLYYTMVQDTNYWNTVIVQTVSPIEATESSRLLQSRRLKDCYSSVSC